MDAQVELASLVSASKPPPGGISAASASVAPLEPPASSLPLSPPLCKVVGAPVSGSKDGVARSFVVAAAFAILEVNGWKHQ